MSEQNRKEKPLLRAVNQQQYDLVGINTRTTDETSAELSRTLSNGLHCWVYPLRGGSMENWGQHLRFAARQLWRSPGFTLTVIITLALSIGANTAIFSLVNALILKSLPYGH